MLSSLIKKYINKDLLDLLLHSKNYISADLLAKAGAFLILPIITKLLSPADYGLYEIFVTTSVIISIFFTLGINSAITTYYFDNTIGNFKVFIRSNLYALLLVNTIILGISILFSSSLSVFLKIDKSIFFLSIIAAFLTSYIEIYLGYLQAIKNSKTYSIISSSKFLFIFIIGIPFILLLKSEKYKGLIYSEIFIQVVLFIISILSLYKISSHGFVIKYIKKAFFFGMPLLPHILSGYLLVQFDKIIINQLVGETETGLYSIAYRIGMIMSIFVSGINKSWVPFFFEKLKESNKEAIVSLSIKTTKLISLIGSMLLLFSNEILIVMADKQYHSSLNVIPYIILSYIFVYYYTIYVNYSFYWKKTLYISIITFITALFNIALNYLIIPKVGYIGAAQTTLLCYIFLFIANYVNVKYIIKDKLFIPIFPIIKYIILPLISMFVVIILYKFISNVFINFSLKIFLTILIIIILYCNEVKRIIFKK